MCMQSYLQNTSSKRQKAWVQTLPAVARIKTVRSNVFTERQSAEFSLGQHGAKRY